MTAHLFVISKEVFQAISFQEVIVTAKAMNAVGIFKPPFDEIDVIVNANVYEVQKFISPRWTPDDTITPDELFGLIIKYRTKNDEYYVSFCNRNDKLRSFISLQEAFIKYENSEFMRDAPRFMEDLKDTFAYIFSTLIVLLATKNIEKRTQEMLIKKQVSASRKRKSSYKYSGITELHIGKISETFGGEGTRGPVRAHLRRGHVRNQRIGEGRKDVKQIFIQPVFVNADDGWIENQRKEYRIKV